MKMLKTALQKHPNALYIQIYSNKMQLLAHDGSILATEIPSTAYCHSRSIIGNYDAAEQTCKQLLKHRTHSVFSTSPYVITEIMEQTEGGLTQVEIRALAEMIFNAGARDVQIYSRDSVSAQCGNVSLYDSSARRTASRSQVRLVTAAVLIFSLLAVFFLVIMQGK
ncbi:rod shape-determining protein [Acinetobacter chinensis]|uniref:Rod shape-determining protein n=2 Tax=Acinetobacter chinensis TaxID=2004650 RepID=A0A3B7LTG3_9GAMM|nr:rod shape-determining protein [Acinetobacter chinensis]